MTSLNVRRFGLEDACCAAGGFDDIMKLVTVLFDRPPACDMVLMRSILSKIEF